MKSALSGRFPLSEMVSQTLENARMKLASAEGKEEKKDPKKEEGKKDDKKSEKKVEQLLSYEKKEHGHIPTPKEEEAEKKASAGEDETEKLAAALDYAADLLLKEADSVENGGESKGGGEQIPTASPVGGRQPYKHDKSKHPVPTSSSSVKTQDNGGSTAMKTTDSETPGGKGAKYPAKGVLKTAAQGVLERIQSMKAAPQATEQEEVNHSKATEGDDPEKTAAGGNEDAEYSRLAKGHGRMGALVGGLNGAVGGALQGGLHGGAKGAIAGGIGGGAVGATGGYAAGRIQHWGAGKLAPAREKKSSAESQGAEALDYILGKVAASEVRGGGETLDDKSAPVPKNPGRELIQSNQSVIDAKRVQAKAPRKAELAQVLTEPAMSKATDSKVQENLRNASKGGVKIAAAKALIQKVAAEGCTCEGKGECRYCKMKAVLDKKKGEKS